MSAATSRPPRLGCCSWSLRPEGPEDLAAACQRLGLSALQLSLKVFHRQGLLAPGWDERRTLDLLAAAGVTVVSAMMATHGEDYATLASIAATGGVRSDAHWKQNARLAVDDAARARRLGVSLVSFHAGFLPERRDDPLRLTMLERLRHVVDAFADQGVAVAFETGQESAATLLEVLADLGRPTAGVNFDPANMILYGMGEPVAALAALGPHVRQVHVKDALPSDTPGQWGAEVPVGTGAVDWPAFFATLAELPAPVDLLIEREAGEQREADIATAITHVGPLLERLS